MKILINYADEQYNPARKWNSYTGKHIAHFDKIYEFAPKDIDANFYRENEQILTIKRGNGLWLWKPYFINKVIEQSNDGDIIFYCDAGALFIRNISPVISQLSEKAPLFVCDIPLIESCFTKPICFEKIEGKEKYKSSNQIIATYFCTLVTPFTRKFIEEWLTLCRDYELLSPSGLGKHDMPQCNYGETFVTHREDQSIFSLLCKKYHIIPHKDISQRGTKPETYRSPYYAYKVPSHTNDTYKPIIFLHKSPRLDFKWLLRYLYYNLKK